MKNIKKVKALIFDYGQVICPQNRDKIAEMRNILGLKEEIFPLIYFKYRLDYDRKALTPEEYWRKVFAECHITPSEEKVKEIIKIDIESWLSVDRNFLAFIEKIRPQFEKIAILSNMPLPILEAMEKSFGWMKHFDSLIFSCRTGSVKPEKHIYEACLSELGLEAEECIFIDDSKINISGAEAIGLHGILYTSLDKLKELLKEIL